jgi:glycogen debranching enzyme
MISSDPSVPPSCPVGEALRVSSGILERNLSEKGLSASTEVYQQVWARDSVISLLGGAVSGNKRMLDALRTSLEYLAAHQDRFGQIPFFVRPQDDFAKFGSVDSNPWFVLGVSYYVEFAGDEAWGRRMAPAVIRALEWCESRDFSKAGLMDSGECDDWADLLCNRGKVLFPNVLYAQALRAAVPLLQSEHPESSTRFVGQEVRVRSAIQDKFWVKPTGSFVDKTHHQVRTHASVSLRARPYFLPWVSLFEYGDRFDTAGNLLAILADVASPGQASEILDFIWQAGLDEPFPVQVLYPSIQEADRDWRDYYRVWGNNLPHQYHNGGIWPWVGGLYVAALVKTGRHEEAKRQCEKLARSLHLGIEPWECREWIHGRSGRPMGAKFQAWSAGMMIYAEYTVRTGTTPGFGTRLEQAAEVPSVVCA